MNKNTFLFFTCVLSAYQCGMIKASEYKSTVLNTPIPQKHAHTTNLSLFSQLNNAKNYTEKLAIIKADSFDAQAVNSEGLPVLCYAIDNNYCYDHVQAIIRHKTFNPNQNDLIFHAFEHKACYDHIQSILKHPQFNPNQTDQSGLSIILHAIKQRACYDHVQSILKHPQFNPNQTDKHNKSLLLVACEQNIAHIIEQLSQRHDLKLNTSDIEAIVGNDYVPLTASLLVKQLKSDDMKDQTFKASIVKSIIEQLITHSKKTVLMTITSTAIVTFFIVIGSIKILSIG